MKKICVVGALFVLFVSSVGSGELSRKPTVTSEIGGDPDTVTLRGPGGKIGEVCSAGIQRTTTEEQPVPVAAFIVDETACSAVSDDLCGLILCGGGLQDQADATCRGAAVCNLDTCNAVQTTDPISTDCLVICWSASVSGTCERANGGGADPFKK